MHLIWTLWRQPVLHLLRTPATIWGVWVRTSLLGSLLHVLARRFLDDSLTVSSSDCEPLLSFTSPLHTYIDRSCCILRRRFEPDGMHSYEL